MRKAVQYFLCLAFLLSTCIAIPQEQSGQTAPSKRIIINAAKAGHAIDGFGVNITPAQWNNGNLKPVIDQLVDDLGATLFRFDCVGLADWLDPSKRNGDGSYPESYLQQVYTGKVFSDAWATFRYLNAKHIMPQFSISGRIPPALGRKDDPRHLEDYDGYAEMVVSMLWWAREKEGLQFSLLSPFNETDAGFPEGPAVGIDDIHPAMLAILNKLDAYNLKDVRLILLDDAYAVLLRIAPILNDTALKNRIAAFGAHTYGNGAEGESGGWFEEKSHEARLVAAVNESFYNGLPWWMTEYGDLDQTNEIEFEFAWRSTRRLLKLLSDGFTAAQAWDAFDNLHEHDAAWATYGLFKTDTTNWTYTAKHRYYAAKQVYRFVPKGFRTVEIAPPDNGQFDVFKKWHNPLKNIRLIAFVSPDGNDLTIVGMSQVESDVKLDIDLSSLHIADGRQMKYYRTSRHEYCDKIEELTVRNANVAITLKERSIFTLTTVQ